MKKIIAVTLALCMLVSTLSPVYAARSTAEVVEAALQLLYYNEGSYGSVNANDNGAVSIGKIQWHGNRALNLLKTIVNMNQSQAKSILGDVLYSEILTSTNWSSRIVNGTEKSAISKLLITSEGKEAQDALATTDVTGYINHGKNLGITDDAALVYFADLENQGGAGMSGRVAGAAASNVGGYGNVTLEVLHNAALADSVAGKYASRRNRTFTYCQGLGWNSGLPSEMTVSGLYMPDVLCNGSVPELTGNVSYAESINWVWVGILDKATSAIIDSSDTNPFSNTFDLTGLLSQLDFASLENGEYTLSVQGTGGGKYWNMYDKDFIVEDAYAAVNDLTMPSAIAKGSSIELTGNVTSNFLMSWIWVGILDKDTSTIIDSADASIWTNTYDLSELLSQLDFASLENGEYTLSVQGTGGGKYWNMYDKDFTVEDAYATVTNLTMPSTIAQGSSLELTGNVTSNFLMSWIWVGILDKNTNATIDYADTNLWSNTYELTDLLSQLDFASLENGEYTLSVQGTGGGKYWNMYNKDFTVTTPTPEHSHTYEAIVTTPTCTEKGYTTYACRCGNSYVSDYVDAVGHDVGEWKIVAAPTCTEDGSESRSCSRCEYTETRAIDAVGHSYTVTVIAPTCTERGYTTNTCDCGDTYVSNEVPAMGHTEETIPAVVETCIETGLTEGKKCSACGEILVTQEAVPALGHDWKGTACQRCDAARENPFTDVVDGSFYIDPVLWAVENGITSGTSKTTFDPSGLCLRAHVVTFLYRAAGSPVPSSTKNPFTDVKSGDFYYNPVLWAVENGITQGTSKTQFGSTQVCNRAAVVTFLWRAFGSPEPKSTNNPFVDVKSTDFFYKPVLWAVENGITAGIDATHFNPAGACNRAQVVTFLYRAYN